MSLHLYVFICLYTPVLFYTQQSGMFMTIQKSVLFSVRCLNNIVITLYFINHLHSDIMIHRYLSKNSNQAPLQFSTFTLTMYSKALK